MCLLARELQIWRLVRLAAADCLSPFYCLYSGRGQRGQAARGDARTGLGPIPSAGRVAAGSAGVIARLVAAGPLARRLVPGGSACLAPHAPPALKASITL